MKITDKLETTKRQIADRLSNASNQYSDKTRKVTFIITGCCCASLCLSLVIFPYVKMEKVKRLPAITKPSLITPAAIKPLLTKQDEKMLQGFITTMDSIKRVDKSTYEKAMKGREGMIDSILFLLRYSGESLIEK